MSTGSGRTVLCIDDDRGTLDYHKALLERRGYEVVTAASAREGLAIAGVRSITVVVIDYNMPEMTGGEVAAAIKRVKPAVPIVMVSSADAIPEEALSVVDAFVPKTGAADCLLPLITRLCEMISGSEKSTRPAILYIDHDSGTLDHHTALLTRYGYDVLPASSAREALEIVEAHPIDVVIVDYHMPEKTGDEIAAAIRRIKPTVPVVMVSSDAKIPKQALSTVDAYVAKDEVAYRLLPVIMRLCLENAPAQETACAAD